MMQKKKSTFFCYKCKPNSLGFENYTRLYEIFCYFVGYQKSLDMHGISCGKFNIYDFVAIAAKEYTIIPLILQQLN